MDPEELAQELREIRKKLTEQCVLFARMDERMKAMESRAGGIGGLAGTLGGLLGGFLAGWISVWTGNK